MKHGAEYARKIKHLYHQLRRQYGKPQPPARDDLVEHLILGILSRCTTEAKAQAAFRRLRESVVDHNELRVTPRVEVAEILGDDLPDAEARARNLVDALNAIYDKHSVVDLAFLRDKPVRDAREYLRSLPGVDEFTASRVVLHGLKGHAIPVDEAVLDLLRKEGMVDADATIAEVQSFLERHIPAAEAAEFAALIHRHAVSRYAKSVAGDGAKRPEKAVAARAAPRVPSRSPTGSSAAARGKGPASRAASGVSGKSGTSSSRGRAGSASHTVARRAARTGRNRRPR